MRFFVTGFLGLFLPLLAFSPATREHLYAENIVPPQVVSARDSLIFLEKQKIAAQENSLTAKTLAVAQSFLGTPYVSGTLDVNANEQLVVNLRQLDCWTLVENSFAIAQTDGSDFQTYLAHLQQFRYWGGVVDGYGSRIHYFSGWLLQAEKNGFLRDLTKEMGGIPYRKKTSYITARPDKYPKIKNAAVRRDLLAAEKRINAHAWHYIPKAKVAAMEHLIQEGDLIILTSAKRDLDIAHQGFAVRRNGRIHVLNASSLSKRVVISKQTLPQYLASQKGQSGIMVARLND